MTDNPSVDRYLKDKAMDHIDHALGRPIWPLKKSYRNYFAIDTRSDLANSFRASPHWRFTGSAGQMAFFSVTEAGRHALQSHLASLHAPTKAFTVAYGGQTAIVPAATPSRARYSRWLAISDCCPDLTFAEFLRDATVRLAA
ncbi:MAG: hypothetical protein J0H82_05960 [Alphaproteobacteria bacterium]|nr:hypothetical protein [Alphaproteobacteria bacterium]